VNSVVEESIPKLSGSSDFDRRRSGCRTCNVDDEESFSFVSLI